MKLAAPKAGEPITDRFLAELVSEVMRALRVTAAPPVVVSVDAAGIRIALSRETRIAMLEPTGEPDSDGLADADLLLWDGDSEEWKPDGGEVSLATAPAEGITAFFSGARGAWLPLGTPLRRFEALQNWTGSLDGSAHFPAKELKRNNNTLAPTGDPFEIYDFQNFSGKMGARGWCALMEGRWEHITSSCPT